MGGKAGSDPVKCLLLKDNKFRKRVFLLLEGTFGGQKQQFKDHETVFALSPIIGVGIG
jgi:hypothetical protein